MVLCLLAGVSGGYAQVELSLVAGPVEVEGSVCALEVVDDSTVYYVGSKGNWGFTEDGGLHWRHDSVVVEGRRRAFRSLAVTGEALHVLSIESPAVLLRSEDRGARWNCVLREDHPDAFFDAMVFWDDREGIAWGDPVPDGSGRRVMAVRVTRDGGRTWEAVPGEALPEVVPGEAAFAASNGNLAVQGDTVWGITGGVASRVFRSTDRGRTWRVFETPGIQGGTMTGLFSIDMWNSREGVAMGGNWEEMGNSRGNKVFTADGGETWELRAEGEGPGYRSCVRAVPGSGGKMLWAVGPPGVNLSWDGGWSWVEARWPEGMAQGEWLTVRFTPDGRVAWLAGRGQVLAVEVPGPPSR